MASDKPSNKTLEPASAAAALAAQGQRRWTDVGRHQTSLFDLLGLLILLEVAGAASVLAYQWRGWLGALVAPLGIVVLWSVLAMVLASKRKPES